MNFGKTLKSVRRELNIKQNDLAKMTGLAQSFISAIESNKKSLPIDTISLICEKLNISKEEFIIKALFEQNVENTNEERLLREIKPFVTRIAKELYSKKV